jgi:hypothetical protein
MIGCQNPQWPTNTPQMTWKCFLRMHAALEEIAKRGNDIAANIDTAALSKVQFIIKNI